MEIISRTIRRRTIGVLIIFALAVLQSACANPPIRLTPEERNELKSQPLYPVYRLAPGFSVLTRGKEVGAVVGGVLFGLLFLPVAGAIESADVDLQKTHGLTDPSRAAEVRLLEHLQQHYELQNVHHLEMIDFDDPDRIKRRFGRGLLLDIQNVGWGLEASSWSRLHLAVAMRASLKRISDGKELWADTCTRNKGGAGRDFTIEQWNADHGRLLHVGLERIGRECGSELWAKFQGQAASDLPDEHVNATPPHLPASAPVFSPMPQPTAAATPALPAAWSCDKEEQEEEEWSYRRGYVSDDEYTLYKQTCRTVIAGRRGGSAN